MSQLYSCDEEPSFHTSCMNNVHSLKKKKKKSYFLDLNVLSSTQGHLRKRRATTMYQLKKYLTSSTPSRAMTCCILWRVTSPSVDPWVRSRPVWKGRSASRISAKVLWWFSNPFLVPVGALDLSARFGVLCDNSVLSCMPPSPSPSSWLFRRWLRLSRISLSICRLLPTKAASRGRLPPPRSGSLRIIGSVQAPRRAKRKWGWFRKVRHTHLSCYFTA